MAETEIQTENSRNETSDGEATPLNDVVVDIDGKEIKALAVETPEKNAPGKNLLRKQTTTMRLNRFLSAADAAPPMEIEFKNMRAKVPEMPGSKKLKLILNGVAGKIKPGELLALMGPSGAGKSTLLNVLGGRFEGINSGSVLLNGEPRTKKFKKYIGYVLQHDHLMPNLTVRETLEVTAMLRLPETMSKAKKMQRVEDIIHIMGLSTCENTMVQMVSGGESKRVSIANEMLMNPSILFLDEPTSGLDSTSAYSILSTLEELCKQGRTIICAIHQPSSQMFAKFHKLLLLASGRVIYHGKASEATNYFESTGYPCPIHYNPADFILELVTDSFESENELLQNKEEIKKTLIAEWQQKGEEVLKAQEAAATEEHKEKLETDEMVTTQLNAKKQLAVPSASYMDRDIASTPDAGNDSKWATNWFTQFTVLYFRSFKHRRGHIITRWKTFEIMAVAIISGLIYFRMDKTEENAQDWIGATFFIQIYVSFMTMYRGVVYFPMERMVVQKERRSGAYRLSSYFFAKVLAEFPIDCLLPFCAVTVFYFLVGLGDSAESYFPYMCGTLLGVFAANSFGTFLGCTVMDFEKSITGLAVCGIGMMLLSGFYVKERNIFEAVGWLKYMSHFRSAYGISVIVISDNVKFKCGDPSAYEHCDDHKHLSGRFIVKDYGTTTHVWIPIVNLFALSLFWWTMAYVFLRKNTGLDTTIHKDDTEEEDSTREDENDDIR